MTEDALVYSFSLVYSPTPIGNTVILKTNPAEVLIECHYQRYAQLPPPTAHPPKKSISWCLPATPADARVTFPTQTHLRSFRSLVVIFQTALKSCCQSLLAQAFCVLSGGFSCHTATEIVQGTLCSTHHQKGVL